MTIIAITRELGTRGQEVAAGIAEALHLRIINHESVEHDLAGRLGVDDTRVHRIAEGEASIVDRLKVDQRKLAIYTAEEVFAFARQGDVVIRGWGASALLRHVPNVLRVRIIAPMRMRLFTVMHRHRIAHADIARREIEHSDAAQAQLLRNLYGLEPDDALLHHVVLNTGGVSVDACVATLNMLAQRPAFQETAATHGALDDKLLEWRIRSVLSDRKFEAGGLSSIDPAAANGRVKLSGVCFDARRKHEAEEIVRNIEGVRDVDNLIRTLPAGAY